MIEFLTLLLDFSFFNYFMPEVSQGKRVLALVTTQQFMQYSRLQAPKPPELTSIFS